MKNLYIKLFIILFIATGFYDTILAQAPEGVVYQAEARDDKGKVLLRANLEVKITIRQDNLTGTIVWEGLHQVTTNDYGMFVLVIGEGTSTYIFDEIDWGNHSHFLNVQVKDPKLHLWVDMGTTQFLSVPYALHAKTAEKAIIDEIDDADADPTNEIQNLADVAAINNSINTQLKNLIDPTEAKDAATKAYVDELEERVRLLEDVVLAEPEGTFVDARDAKEYRWVKIGRQIWMAENLAYNTGSGWSYTYWDKDKYIISRLYNWHDALTACPEGWHLPADEEWKQMEREIGMSLLEVDKNAYRGTNEGAKLKSTYGWYNQGSGSDDYNFSALPVGRYSNGSVGYIGRVCGWWTATDYNDNYTWMRYLVYSSSKINRNGYNKGDGLSIRCVKD